MPILSQVRRTKHYLKPGKAVGEMSYFSHTYRSLCASINQTLSRTVLTSGHTVLVLLALYLLGGKVLHGFAFALLVGMLSGAYSTVFIASPILVYWDRLTSDLPAGTFSFGMGRLHHAP